MDHAKTKRNSLINTLGNRRKAFQKKIRYGDIFVCVSCERWLYSTNVRDVPVQIKVLEDGSDEDVWDICPGEDGKIDGVDIETWTKCVPQLRQEFRSRICHNEKREEKWFICYACHGHMKKGKMPPMCAQNGLKVEQIPEEFKDMTQLEQDCCATNKLFMKITIKGKMRWKNRKEKIVNVPVKDSDILNTVSALPRLPDEAGLVELKWQYKKEWKTPYKAQLARKNDKVPKVSEGTSESSLQVL